MAQAWAFKKLGLTRFLDSAVLFLFAPEGQQVVATGGTRSDDSRAKCNPWWPSPVPKAPAGAAAMHRVCRPCRGYREFSPSFHGFRVDGGDIAATPLHPWLQPFGPFGAKTSIQPGTRSRG